MTTGEVKHFFGLQIYLCGNAKVPSRSEKKGPETKEKRNFFCLYMIFSYLCRLKASTEKEKIIPIILWKRMF